MSTTTSRATARRTRRATAGLASLGLALSAVVAVSTSAQAATDSIVVTSVEDSGPGTLRDALAQASGSLADDHITFAPSVLGEIRLISGQLSVTVGGGSGNLDIEGPGRDSLTIDAGGKSRILDLRGPDDGARPTVAVSGLTLTRGSAYGAGYSQTGGGAVRAVGTDLQLAEVEVSSSGATLGGGVLLQGGSLLVDSSTLRGDVAGSLGNDPDGSGGGLAFDDLGVPGVTLEVSNSRVTDNRAGLEGGGIVATGDAPVLVTRSVVSGNGVGFTWRGMEAAFVYGTAGGISAGNLTVTDSSIVDNTAARTAGGISARHLEVTRSTIAGNTSRDSAGGLTASTLTMTSSTVNGNRAATGGGIVTSGGTPSDITLSTIVSNSAVTGGGVVASGELALRGTVVALNAGGDLGGAGHANLDHALVQEPGAFDRTDRGGSITGVDPRVAPLAYHGGPTRTQLPASNSPVIDQGDAFGPVDQRGFARPVDAPGSPNAADGSDIGAVELTPSDLTGLPQIGVLARPTIIGPATLGTVLHTDGGTWDRPVTARHYQWLRDGVPIPYATGATYELGWNDYGANFYGEDGRVRISVQVTADADGFRSSTALSDLTDYTTFDGLHVEGRPVVTGAAKVGSRLKADARSGSVRPAPAYLRIEWFLNGHEVTRAEDAHWFRLPTSARGKRVQVRFTYYPRVVQVEDSWKPLVRTVKVRHRVR